MQKVHSFFRAAYKTTNSNFPSRYSFTIAYILYLALEEGSPFFKQILFVLLISFFIKIIFNKISFDFFS